MWSGSGGTRNASRIITGNILRKRPPGRPGMNWKTNINMNEKKIWYQDVK
jgi:hypothetical protein